MNPKNKRLYHVTLTTGHVRWSPRSEVGDDTLAALRPLVAAAVAARTPIPGFPSYTLNGVGGGKCGVFTVWHGLDPILTVGIGGHSRCGRGTWAALHRDFPGLATDPGKCPPEPWCAARLEAGSALHPDAMEWLGDFERCLAWTFLERGIDI